MKVRKAVVPAAGFGTRMLPFTRAVPKELVPLLAKPVIQYVLEEAAESGIEEVLLIISSGKEAIIRHFNPAHELETRLAERGRDALLGQLRAIDRIAHLHYVYQQQLDGLGGAIRCARSFVGDEPFAVLLGDTVMSSSADRPVIGQLIDLFEAEADADCVVGLEEVPRERVSSYGIAAGRELSPGVLALDDLVEKPSPDSAPGNLAVAARYVFSPEIFSSLDSCPRGRDNELQLTDAMRALLNSGHRMLGRRISGRRHDLGSRLGFLEANVLYGLRDPELREKFAEFLRRIDCGNC